MHLRQFWLAVVAPVAARVPALVHQDQHLLLLVVPVEVAPVAAVMVPDRLQSRLPFLVLLAGVAKVKLATPTVVLSPVSLQWKRRKMWTSDPTWPTCNVVSRGLGSHRKVTKVNA